ncbi:MAG: hypothetical protein U0936_01820 [Planctomycetaceae bacterium]
MKGSFCGSGRSSENHQSNGLMDLPPILSDSGVQSFIHPQPNFRMQNLKPDNESSEKIAVGLLVGFRLKCLTGSGKGVAAFPAEKAGKRRLLKEPSAVADAFRRRKRSAPTLSWSLVVDMSLSWGGSEAIRVARNLNAR